MGTRSSPETFYDPTVSMQMNRGFRLEYVVTDYLDEPPCRRRRCIDYLGQSRIRGRVSHDHNYYRCRYRRTIRRLSSETKPDMKQLSWKPVIASADGCGQIVTLPDIPIEFGAELIHGNTVNTWKWVNKLGLKTLHWQKTGDSMIRMEDGRWMTMLEARKSLTRTGCHPFMETWAMSTNPRRTKTSAHISSGSALTEEQLRYVQRSFANAEGDNNGCSSTPPPMPTCSMIVIVQMIMAIIAFWMAMIPTTTKLAEGSRHSFEHRRLRN